MLRPLNQICSCAYTNQSALQFLRVELDDEKPVVSQHLLFVVVVTTYVAGSVAFRALCFNCLGRCGKSFKPWLVVSDTYQILGL